MNNLIIATQTGGILKPFAWVLGKILELIYDGLSLIGVYNIGACIIVFTIVVRMLMLPMTIRQQKFSKLNAVMSPEIQAIQKKYQNKKDQESQLKQQEEIKAVYDKYGTSATGSCLQLIIQMPILFALYRVVTNIPAYVQPVKNIYLRVLYGLDKSQMKEFFGLNKLAKNLSETKLNGCIDAMTGYTRGNSGVSLTDGTALSDILAVADKSVASKINEFNSFFGYDLSMSPSAMRSAGMISLVVALIIPVLAGLFQLLSVELSTRLNKSASTAAAGNMGASMKIMNYVMPLFSVYMCYVLSTGIGLYWVTGSAVMMLQQVFINLYMRNINVDDIIEKNKEKAEKKAKKRKAKDGVYRERVLEASKINAKGVSSNSNVTAEEKEEKIRKAKEAMSKGNGSLASKANMVNDYNKRNKK